ncbi:hypothetical protein Tco_1414799, partial [Tanacetum coccineum]
MLDDDSGNKMEPVSHKENPKVLDDDDVNDDEQKDEKKMMLYLMRWVELTDTVSPSATTTSKDPQKEIRISSKYIHLLVLHEITNVIHVHPTITTSTDITSSADLQQQLYLKMKSNLQDQANDPTLWDVLKQDDAPPEGSKNPHRMYPSNNRNNRNGMNGKRRNPNEPPRYLYNKDLFFLKNGNTKEKKYILSLHKIHAELFPEADLGEKMNHWVRKEFKNFNKDVRLSIQRWKDSWHKRVYKKNQRKVKDNSEDYLSNHNITEVFRITTDQLYGLDFMEQIILMRDNDKPDSFFEVDFMYLNKNNIKDLYYLYRNKKVNYRETKLMNSLITFIRSRVIWERIHDFQLGIESCQIRVNLTAPTLTFIGIEAHEPYLIVDKPNTGLIYLNNKDEKRVMYLVEIVKFCDVALERVLNEVKPRIFQNQFWKKPPPIGEVDLDIMKAFDREISKLLRHRQQMR